MVKSKKINEASPTRFGKLSLKREYSGSTEDEKRKSPQKKNTSRISKSLLQAVNLTNKKHVLEEVLDMKSPSILKKRDPTDSSDNDEQTSKKRVSFQPKATSTQQSAQKLKRESSSSSSEEDSGKSPKKTASVQVRKQNIKKELVSPSESSSSDEDTPKSPVKRKREKSESQEDNKAQVTKKLVLKSKVKPPPSDSSDSEETKVQISKKLVPNSKVKPPPSDSSDSEETNVQISKKLVPNSKVKPPPSDSSDSEETKIQISKKLVVKPKVKPPPPDSSSSSSEDETSNIQIKKELLSKSESETKFLVKPKVNTSKAQSDSEDSESDSSDSEEEVKKPGIANGNAKNLTKRLVNEGGSSSSESSDSDEKTKIFTQKDVKTPVKSESSSEEDNEKPVVTSKPSSSFKKDDSDDDESDDSSKTKIFQSKDKNNPNQGKKIQVLNHIIVSPNKRKPENFLERVQQVHPEAEKTTVEEKGDVSELSDSDSIYLLHVPRSISSKQLKKLEINVKSDTKIKIDDDEYIIKPTRTQKTEPMLVIGNSKKFLEFKSTFRMEKVLEPKNAPRELTQDGQLVPFPKDFKTRHGIFGSTYENKLILDELVSEKLSEMFVDKPRKHKKKRKTKQHEETVPETEVIFQLLNSTKLKQETSSSKKKDKKQNKAEVKFEKQSPSVDDTRKKEKRNKTRLSFVNSTMVPGTPQFNPELSRIVSNDTPTGKKCKKRHAETELQLDVVSAKKLRKSQDDSEMNSSKKSKKKKHHKDDEDLGMSSAFITNTLNSVRSDFSITPGKDKKKSKMK